MRKNPFKEGIQVVGEGYIGRIEEINYLMRILSRNEKDGGVVISGLTRMGKTSLVKNCFALAEEKGLLEKNNIVTVSITVSTRTDFSDILKSLTDELYDALEERELLSPNLQKEFDGIRSIIREGCTDLLYEQDRSLKRILKKLNKENIKTVVLLDEFDDARRAFEYKDTRISTNFQKFRDYATEAKYNCTFILTSRTNIERIDASLPSGSNLRGAFTEIALRGFTDQERNMFFEKIDECGVYLSTDQRQEFIWYAGRSPYLFSKMACRILDCSDDLKPGDIPIKTIVGQCKNDFISYFDALINYMRGDGLFNKYVQVFFGPVYDLNEKDIDLLKQYGYIYHLNDDLSFSDISFSDGKERKVYTYQTLSEYFLEYVRTRVNLDDSLKIWSELINAENTLRKAVESGLRNKYGNDDWIVKLRQIAESEEKGFLFSVEKADQFIISSRVNFGDVVDDNPLYVISINALGNIIKAFWDDCYHDLFDPPYQKLNMLLDELKQLNKVRNPLAHGKNDYLSQEDKDRASKYCRKIMHVLSAR